MSGVGELEMNDASKVKVELAFDKDLLDLATRSGLDLNAVADQALQRALEAGWLERILRSAHRVVKS